MWKWANYRIHLFPYSIVAAEPPPPPPPHSMIYDANAYPFGAGSRMNGRAQRTKQICRGYGGKSSSNWSNWFCYGYIFLEFIIAFLWQSRDFASLNWFRRNMPVERDQLCCYNELTVQRTLRHTRCKRHSSRKIWWAHHLARICMETCAMSFHLPKLLFIW